MVEATSPADPLDPRIARLKKRMLEAPYEICLARALHFTRSYKQTEGMDPALRNALALKRTLEQQRIFVHRDEYLAGSKTEKFLAGPLSVERGDFLRTVQMELDILHLKQRPFFISDEDRRVFLGEILPYWDGRTVRDRKAEEWQDRQLIHTRPGLMNSVGRIASFGRFWRSLDPNAGRKLAGANLKAPLSYRRLRTIYDARFELARNNPTPAVFCFDIQGHLSLGVDKVVSHGMDEIIEKARSRRSRLQQESPGDTRKHNFLTAVIKSLQAATHYAARFVTLSEQKARAAGTSKELKRLSAIASHLRQVPAGKPRTFHEALQAVWFTLMVGEIQYGTHDVFAVGRPDQYLYPLFARDRRSGQLSFAHARALVQEFMLKLSANIEPIPEAGMETNGVLGNSQHVVTVGGLTPEGRDASNELTTLFLDAYEQMGGTVNQLSVRLSGKSPDDLVQRTAALFGRANGIAVFNDDAIVPALASDGMAEGDARDYCIVGCVETSGQSDTHGCPGGHELTLPAVLMMTLTRGLHPSPAPGQKPGIDSGDPRDFHSFDDLIRAFRRQLNHHIDVLIQATEGKDRAVRDLLPAPYVSALMDDCIETARDITEGGARYDFTSLDVRGLATLTDSLWAIQVFVYEQRALDLLCFIKILKANFQGHETLRQRLIRVPPKYGRGDPDADAKALKVVHWIGDALAHRRNIRGGRYRACYYSYGNHVLDGLLLGATPDGRRKGEPVSNGISPSNLIESHAGPQGPLKSAAIIPPALASSGVSLNMRFHPRMLRTAHGVATFASMLRTYFRLGGMHLQPNVVSTETLQKAQKHPEQYRDLVVKVSGYSAYFTDLGQSIQEDIIARHQFGEP